jgi:DNA-binding CsgD family transcriptional regulator
MELRFETGSRSLGKVHDAVAAVAGAIGSDRMESALAGAANGLTRVDRLYAFEQRGTEREPILYRCWAKKGTIEQVVAEYRERYFKTDPINDVLDKLHSSDPAATLRLRSCDVPDPDYRKACFDEPAIGERVSVIRRLNAKWLVLNCARGRQAGAFTRDDIALIDLFGAFALPLLARHEELFETMGVARNSALSINVLEERFGQLLSALTTRERQVCARTLMGMTAEAIALDLLIGRASVLTYRQRAYRRLNICSAYQLSTLVLR